jgi:hypothetical protein
MKKNLTFLLLSMFFLVGCAGNTINPTAAPTSISSAPTQAAYPGADQGYPSISLGYPSVSDDPNNIKLPIPTMPPAEMQAGTGIVEGQLLLNSIPLAGINLYLADFLKDANGKEYVASVSIQNSPFAVTDAEGKFRFVNVPANRYGLVIEDGTQSFILLPPKGDGDLIAEVQDQKIFDLGKLDYQELPIHP